MPVPPDSTPFPKKDGKFKGKNRSGADSLKDGPSNVEALRSMPVDSDVERAVLSCLLKSPSELIGKSIETMTKEYFYIPAHLTIYETLLDLFSKGSDIDIVELNEAFAPQALAVIRDFEEMGIDPEKVNPVGNAIALGHPLGATGSILTLTCAYGLRRTKKRYGIVTMCIGGGQGITLVLDAEV